LSAAARIIVSEAAMSWSLLLLTAICSAQPAEEDLTCLKPAEGQPAASKLFYAALQQQAYAALDRRTTAFEELKTDEQIKSYQQRLKDIFTQQLGGFPAAKCGCRR
jgi:hypothetical protein